MYHSTLALAFCIACVGQLRAEEVDLQESAMRTHEVNIVEVALADEISESPEDIAAKYRQYIKEGKGEELQFLQVTAVDGLKTRYVRSYADELLISTVTQSGGFEAEETLPATVTHRLGSGLTLEDTKSTGKSVQFRLQFSRAFVPDLSSTSKDSDVVTFSVDDRMKLKRKKAVAIEVKPRNNESKAWGKKIYLIVSLAPIS